MGKRGRAENSLLLRCAPFAEQQQEVTKKIVSVVKRFKLR